MDERIALLGEFLPKVLTAICLDYIPPIISQENDILLEIGGENTIYPTDNGFLSISADSLIMSRISEEEVINYFSREGKLVDKVRTDIIFNSDKLTCHYNNCLFAMSSYYPGLDIFNNQGQILFNNGSWPYLDEISVHDAFVDKDVILTYDSMGIVKVCNHQGDILRSFNIGVCHPINKISSCRGYLLLFDMLNCISYLYDHRTGTLLKTFLNNNWKNAPNIVVLVDSLSSDQVYILAVTIWGGIAIANLSGKILLDYSLLEPILFTSTKYKPIRLDDYLYIQISQNTIRRFYCGL